MNQLPSLAEVMAAEEGEDCGTTAFIEAMQEQSTEEETEPTAPYLSITFKDGQQFTIEIKPSDVRLPYLDKVSGLLCVAKDIFISPESLAILQLIREEPEIEVEPAPETPTSPAFPELLTVPVPRS